MAPRRARGGGNPVGLAEQVAIGELVDESGLARPHGRGHGIVGGDHALDEVKVLDDGERVAAGQLELLSVAPDTKFGKSSSRVY